jgi:hypothetical protein
MPGVRDPHIMIEEETQKKSTVYPTKLPGMKKTANEPGDPRIEEDDTRNSHRDANSGGRPVPSGVRTIARIVPMVVGICEVDRFYRRGFGFLLTVRRLA